MPETGGDLLHGRRIPRRSAHSRVRFTASGVRTTAEPSTAFPPNQAELEHMRDAVTSLTAGVRLKRAVVKSFPCLALTPKPRSTPDPKARL
jgi:hypothetical protein